MDLWWLSLIPLTDWLLLLGLFIGGIVITGSIWQGIKGEIDYRGSVK